MTPAPNRHSKIEGNAFEEILARAARFEGIAIIKIPDGARRVPRPGGRPLLLPVKTPFDFFFAKNGKVAVVDAKTTSGSNFSYGMITVHQVLSLLDMENNGVRAGYIVYFRKVNQIVFLSATQLALLRPLQSLTPADGMNLGTVFEMKLGGLLSG